MVPQTQPHKVTHQFPIFSFMYEIMFFHETISAYDRTQNCIGSQRKSNTVPCGAHVQLGAGYSATCPDKCNVMCCQTLVWVKGLARE